MLDEDFTNINMMLDILNLDLDGLLTWFANDSRWGISRDEGIKIVERYDGICSDAIIDKYCQYVNISTSHF